ncbi:MAG: prolipoprotein diacylglyceryl transferase, partial [Calditrichaeota bacterium]|nr:prolipoprotein diacylglyceryl transferase [Calditrichota bacterium]
MYPTIDLEFITINSFILFNCMGFFLSLFYARRNLLLNNYDHDFFYSIALIAIFSSLFGAKLYFVIENPDYFKTAFLAKFFSLSGSGWYGGFVVTFLTLSIYIKYTNNNLLKVLDILSLSLPIGIIFGRIACFLAGDGCYGVVSHLPWAMDFPNGIIPV